jgi:hypothetical protein
MSPQIEAALIAGVVTLISVVGTLVVTRWGFQATMNATKLTAEEAHADTLRTLTEQREQLDRMLEEQHVRTLNERFATAAEKLGDDKPPASGAGLSGPDAVVAVTAAVNRRIPGPLAAHMTIRGQRYTPACPNWLSREFRK